MCYDVPLTIHRLHLGIVRHCQGFSHDFRERFDAITHRFRIVGSDISSAMEGMLPPDCTRFIYRKDVSSPILSPALMQDTDHVLQGRIFHEPF